MKMYKFRLRFHLSLLPSVLFFKQTCRISDISPRDQWVNANMSKDILQWSFCEETVVETIFVKSQFGMVVADEKIMMNIWKWTTYFF